MIPGVASFLFSPDFWLAVLACVSLPFVAVGLYTAWVCYKFVPTMTRVFEETPIFAPPAEPPHPDAEDVRFQTADGLWLQGCWLRAGPPPRGVVVFSHEFLSNRWSCQPYCLSLRAAGFDVFAFDFRNHGDSQSLDGYVPIQYPSDYEVLDIRAALAHVRFRFGGNPPPIALLGVSRGGGAAILAAAIERDVRAIATDGAFPTHSLQLAYMLRWAGIFAGHYPMYRLTPTWYFALLSAIARWLGARRHRCRFPKIERAIRRIAPRRLLMIHGEKDSYISPDIARQFFDLAAEPKQFWLVPGAKHNGAIQTAPDAYIERLRAFFATNSAENPQK